MENTLAQFRPFTRVLELVPLFLSLSPSLLASPDLFFWLQKFACPFKAESINQQRRAVTLCWNSLYSTIPWRDWLVCRAFILHSHRVIRRRRRRGRRCGAQDVVSIVLSAISFTFWSCVSACLFETVDSMKYHLPILKSQNTAIATANKKKENTTTAAAAAAETTSAMAQAIMCQMKFILAEGLWLCRRCHQLNSQIGQLKKSSCQCKRAQPNVTYSRVSAHNTHTHSVPQSVHTHSESFCHTRVTSNE